MALVQLGGGVLDARGSIGGQVFSKNRNGNYIRARTTPVNPRSTRQNKIRSVVQFLAPYWSGTLTQLQRDAWEVYAAAITRANKLGAQIKLTGYNMFIRTNTPLLQSNKTIVPAAPTLLTLPPADPLFACTVDETAQQISVAYNDTLAWTKQDGGHLIVSMSIPKAAGNAFIGGPMRVAAVIDGIDPGGVASPQVMAVPFPVAQGQEVVCSARIAENDGRLSDVFRSQSSVTA